MSDITEIVNWLLHVLYHSGFPGVSKISSLQGQVDRISNGKKE